MVNTTRMSWVSVPQPNDEPAMLEQIQIGNITIHRIVEQEGAFFEALRFFRTLTKELLEENRHWLHPRFLDQTGKLVFSIQSYLLQMPNQNILIDTCVGNHKPRASRPDRYEKNLAAQGSESVILTSSCARTCTLTM
jgi:hypothetical protein